eukprot:682832-Rhodomonas_salina.2
MDERTSFRVAQLEPLAPSPADIYVFLGRRLQGGRALGMRSGGRLRQRSLRGVRSPPPTLRCIRRQAVLECGCQCRTVCEDLDLTD